MMAESGVRSSWLILARNKLFAMLAASASPAMTRKRRSLSRSALAMRKRSRPWPTICPSTSVAPSRLGSLGMMRRLKNSMTPDAVSPTPTRKAKPVRVRNSPGVTVPSRLVS